MKKENQWAKLAVTAILAAGIGVGGVGAVIAGRGTYGKMLWCCQKGMNDCAARGHSCSGLSTMDNDPAEWKYVA